MNKSLSQSHFGKNAAEYLTSRPHAQGQSLERLVALAKPRPDWHVLDVATGAGHTAYAFAPHVARAWATDITDEMLDLVRGEVAKRKLANLRVAHAKAEALPFEDATFDLVTCRIAPASPAFSTRPAACSSRRAPLRWSTTWCRQAASAIS
jgi:SAM-dependent methyltransferase